ncbi:MAG: hypothetical protein Q9161_008087 [Pseudevernia consocians]
MPKRARQSPAPRYTKGPPPYPYGPAQHYKQSDSGLYGGATIQFGNKVSEKHADKSRRVWRPNIHNKRLWSDGLGRFVQVKVQARVLRTIDKCGGLDEYLLGEKPRRVRELGVEGWRLRWMVMRTVKVKRRVKAEREALGLPVTMQKGKAGSAESAWVDTSEAEMEEREKEEDDDDPSSSSNPTGLEDLINSTIQDVEAEIIAERQAHRGQQAPKPSSQTTELLYTLANPPRRRYPHRRQRAWRAQRAFTDPNKRVFTAEEVSTLKAAIARIPEEAPTAERGSMEELVGAEMDALEGEGRERLAMALERLRDANRELELAKAEGGAAEKKGLGKEKEAEGGILGKIKGLFGRR